MRVHTLSLFTFPCLKVSAAKQGADAGLGFTIFTAGFGVVNSTDPSQVLGLGSARGPNPMISAAQSLAKSHDASLASLAKTRDATSAHVGKSHDEALASFGNRPNLVIPPVFPAHVLKKVSASQV